MKSMVLIYTIPLAGFFTLFFFLLLQQFNNIYSSIGIKLLSCQRSKLSFQSFHRTPKPSVLVFCFSVLLLYGVVDALKAFRNLMYTNLFSLYFTLKFYNVKLKKSISSQGLLLFMWTEQQVRSPQLVSKESKIYFSCCPRKNNCRNV